MERTQLIVDILACQLGEFYTPESLALESTATLVSIRATVRARLAQDILDWREDEERRERMTPAWFDD